MALGPTLKKPVAYRSAFEISACRLHIRPRVILVLIAFIIVPPPPKLCYFIRSFFTIPFWSSNIHLIILFLQVKLRLQVMLPPGATAQSAKLLTTYPTDSAQSRSHVFIIYTIGFGALFCTGSKVGRSLTTTVK
jgi:hypothetical protein